jgi:hypothetical protein
MKNLVIVVALVLTPIFISGQEKPAAPAKQEAPKELDQLSLAKATIHLLRAENAQLKADIQDLKNQVATLTLTSERSTLEAIFRKELQCKEADKFNWQTLRCENVKKDSK